MWDIKCWNTEVATCTGSDLVEQRKLLANTAWEHQQAQGLETPGICDQGGEAKSRRTGQGLCKQSERGPTPISNNQRVLSGKALDLG